MFVRKWVDYSFKYGLGYILSDHSSGIMFNDKSSILASEGRKTFSVVPQDCSDGPFKEYSQDSHEVLSEELSQKVKLFRSFTKYLRDKKDAKAS